MRFYKMKILSSNIDDHNILYYNVIEAKSDTKVQLQNNEYTNKSQWLESKRINLDFRLTYIRISLLIT